MPKNEDLTPGKPSIKRKPPKAEIVEQAEIQVATAKTVSIFCGHCGACRIKPDC